ncbi:MAG: YCF48-related protein, partial [Bacteroidota bacterium]|nr:YCF48-related protein [Bacteroidota bacterium]
MKKIILLSLIILFNNFSAHSQSTWFWQQPLPTGNYLYSVDFVNTNTGYAVGTVGTIMKTTNGGGNWEVQNSGF